MHDRSLFAPAPRRKRGLILTLSGSLLFHGSLVGVAAFWTTHPTVGKPVITVISDDPLLPADLQLPAAPPSEPQPEAPVLTAMEPSDNPPPLIEPGAEDMTLAIATPRPAVRSMSSHPTSASAAPRASQAASGVSTGGLANANPGAGRPGVRWNVPKPIYPPALRLAHVQGSGSVRVTTDGSGRVVSASMEHSTGSAVLDDQTCQTAKLQWSGPPNSTTTVPITYQLQ